MKNAKAILALALAGLLLAGCLQLWGPAATPTPQGSPTPTLSAAQQQAYDQLEQELANMPEVNASDVEGLLTK